MDTPKPSGAPVDGEGSPVGRRLVLGMLGLGAAGLAAAPYLQRGTESALSAVSGKDPTGVTELLPNGGGFRYYSVASSVPHKGERDYDCSVGGLVEKPGTYTLADLRKLPQERMVRDVQCVTGWRVPKTAFEGVRLSTLLEAFGVRPEARAVRFTCFDGVYSESLTMKQAMRDDVLVALRMQDKPLSHSHGGPVRLYVAPMYFYKSAKWLSGITLTSEVQPGYWEKRGYRWTPGSAGRTDVMMLRQQSEHPGPAGADAGEAAPGEDAAEQRVLRFVRAVRWSHHATAVLMAVCVGTALCLYLPGLAELIGRRWLMVTLHKWSGLLLPVPLLLGLASRALRADLRRLNRFGPHDRAWLRAAVRARRPARVRARTGAWRRASSTPGRRSSRRGQPGRCW